MRPKVSPYDGKPSATTASSSNKRDSTVVAEGVYLPPAKRRLLQQQQQQQQPDRRRDEEIATADHQTTATDTTSIMIQKQSWEDQMRVVHGTINRLNKSTIKPLIYDLFSKVNLIRFRGVLVKSVLLAAISSIQYSNVYAAMIAAINTKLPEIGELVVKRSILLLRKSYQRREKQSLIAVVLFLGHLFHQNVIHEILILQIITILLDEVTMTDDSVEVAIRLLTLTGQRLLDTSPASIRAVVDRLRTLLHEGQLDKRVEHKLEQLLELRKSGFNTSEPAIAPELDLVELDDQITFDDMSLDDETLTNEVELDTFRPDPEYGENEQQWKTIRAEILGLNDDDDEEEDGDDDDDDAATTDDSVVDEQQAEPETQIVPATETSTAVTTQVIHDLSEADLVHLRRTIYLTIMSSATFEECAHKLAKIDIPPGREEELINMIIECCSQERTFLRYYGLIAARFCLLSGSRWCDAFIAAFQRQYTTIHRLETNKLRNVAKLFAHLLHTDSIPWSVLSIIHLNEDETTSSSRIFIKILVQEMAEALGIAILKQRFETDDPEFVEWYKGMFPKDNVRNTRYAINFFTSVGLGPLTDDLREYLKIAPKLILEQAQQLQLQQQQANANRGNKEDNDDSSTSSSSSSSGSSSSDSSSSSTYTSSSSSRSTSSSSYSSRSDSRSMDSSGSTSYSSYSNRRRSKRSRGDDRSRPTKQRRRSSSYSSRSSSQYDSSVRNNKRTTPRAKSSRPSDLSSRRYREESRDTTSRPSEQTPHRYREE